MKVIKKEIISGIELTEEEQKFLMKLYEVFDDREPLGFDDNYDSEDEYFGDMLTNIYFFCKNNQESDKSIDSITYHFN